MMLGYVVTAVNQIVAHDVDKVNQWPNLWSLLRSEGNHVTLEPWDCNQQHLVLSNGLANGFQEKRVVLNLRFLVGIRILLVVLSIPTRVFPVNVC